MNQKTLNLIKQFVAQQTRTTPDPFHGFQHAQNVARNAHLLWSLLPPKQAKTIDLRLLQACCYLHDLHTTHYPPSFSNFLFESKIVRHFLPPILNQLPLKPQERQLIFETIIHHPLAFPFHRLNRHRSLYAQLLQDADFLDQFNPQRLQLLKLKKQPGFFHRLKLFLLNFNHPNTVKWLIKHFSNQPPLVLQAYNYLSRSFQYIERGNPNHPTILFLHGYADSAYTFLPAINQLSTQYHLIALELPFHQKRAIYNLNEILDYISVFLASKKLKQQKITISGFSLGGIIASHYAIKYPDDIGHLILLNSLIPKPSPFFKLATNLLFYLFKIPLFSPLIAHLNLHLFSSFKRLRHDYFSVFNLKHFSHSIHRTTLNILKDTFKSPLPLKQLQQLNIPITAVLFEDDPLLPPQKYASHFIQDNIPLTIFPQGGHASELHSWNLALAKTIKATSNRYTH